jgi:hypothetical protein
LQLADAIARQDAAHFEATYRRMIEACYSCHKASDKPFLKPGIPQRLPSAILQFDPKAPWPK